MDNIAIVPASLLGLKALWQTAANTLPQGGVLLCHSQQNARQRRLLERIGETFRQQGHAVMHIPIEQVAYSKLPHLLTTRRGEKMTDWSVRPVYPSLMKE